MRLLAASLTAATLCAALLAPHAPADVTFTVTFDDSGGLLTPYHDQLQSHLIAAGEAWARRLDGDVNLLILVRPNTQILYATGRSLTSGYVETQNGLDIFEQGAAYHIRTGTSVIPDQPDIEIEINPDYITTFLWFDPDPVNRAGPNDSGRTDAMSVCLHEIGHALAYNGFRDLFNGSLPGDYQSTFDRHVTFDGADFWFNGPAAVALFGGPVPLTFGNIFHLGNAPPRPGSDLIPQLMNGVVFTDGVRYFISDMDWAILADVGIPLTPPPPACPADFNGDTFVNPDDLADFITCFFLDVQFPGFCPDADFNADTSRDPDDLADFITAFFLAVQFGC